MEISKIDSIIKNDSFLSSRDEVEKEVIKLINCKKEDEFQTKLNELAKKYRLNIRNSGYEYELSWQDSPANTVKLLPLSIYTWFSGNSSMDSSVLNLPEILVELLPKKDNFIKHVEVSRSYGGDFSSLFCGTGFTKATSYTELVSKIIYRVNQTTKVSLYWIIKNDGIKSKTFLNDFLKDYSSVVNIYFNKENKNEIVFGYENKENKIVFDFESVPKEFHSCLLKEISTDSQKTVITMAYLNGAVETYKCQTNTILRKEPLVNGKDHCETGPAKVLYRYDSDSDTFVSAEEHYFLNGKRFSSKEEWAKAVEVLNKEKEAVTSRGLTAPATVATVNHRSETPVQTIEKEKSTMSKVLDTVKKDGREVAKRVVVTKATEAVTSALANMISPGNDKKASSTRKSVEAALKTPGGKAVVSFMMGAIVPVVEDKVPEKYRAVVSEGGQEARVQAEVYFAGAIVEQLAKPAMKVALGGIQSSLDKVIESETTEVRADLPAAKTTPELSEVGVEAAKASLAGKKSKAD